MSISKQRGSIAFYCDICGARRIDRERGNWDESRLTFVRAREAGWRLSKQRGGRWEALCPDCASFSNYSLLPEISRLDE